jgi:pyruvate dehydrogenase phosphatase regulatory subunit
MAERLNYKGISDKTPVLVDMDHSVFINANQEKTVCGGFVEDEIRALQTPQGIQTEWKIPCPDWDRFCEFKLFKYDFCLDPNLKSLIDRCPALGQLKTADLHNGIEMYTPDNYPIIGESEHVSGYFVANGLNGQGLAMAGGLGDVLSQWIMKGVTSLTNRDISKFDITRFTIQHTNPHYLYERAPEIASHTFKPLHYSYQCHTARNLRMSPIYQQLKNAGGIFGEIMGYERPLWFNPKASKESMLK